MEELMRGLSPYEQWMVHSNLNTAATAGREATVNTLRANGYQRVADAVDGLLQRANGRTEFVVVGEHTLGYITPLQPSQVQILHGSVLRGAKVGWQHGCLIRPLGDRGMRLATRQDFIDYNINGEPYEARPETYNFPTD